MNRSAECPFSLGLERKNGSGPKVPSIYGGPDLCKKVLKLSGPGGCTRLGEEWVAIDGKTLRGPKKEPLRRLKEGRSSG
jgi:hypothetical protein